MCSGQKLRLQGTWPRELSPRSAKVTLLQILFPFIRKVSKFGWDSLCVWVRLFRLPVSALLERLVKARERKVGGCAGKVNKAKTGWSISGSG